MAQAGAPSAHLTTVGIHAHAGGTAGASHGFILLHPVTPTKAGVAAGEVTRSGDPGVKADHTLDLVVVYVEDTANSTMAGFHALLDRLATKYLDLVKGGAYLFNFEHHF